MSVVSKIQEFGKMKKRDLLGLQHEIEAKQMDLEREKDDLMEKIIAQREVVNRVVEEKKIDEEKVERTKLENLEKTHKDKSEAFKDNLEILKAIEQIFKIREDRKLSASSRIYGFFGLLITGGGVALAYGSDTFGTLMNKKTYEAAKTAVTKFFPKF